MPTCIVCLNSLKDPAALPCGHVFCYDCISHLIRVITPYTNNHFCPTCKQPYTVFNVDPNLVPYHLRAYISPSVRRLKLEYPISLSATSSSSSNPNSECERLLVENVSLKACCFVWRKRAAVHAAATLGLVGLARLARDYGMRMKHERDELQTKYDELEKQYNEKSFSPASPPESPSCPPSPRDAQLRSSTPRFPRLPHIAELDLPPMEANLPPSLKRSPASEHDPHPLSPSLYRLASPAASEESYCSDCPDCTDKKRKRSMSSEDDPSETARPIKRSHSASPDLLAPQPLSPGRAIADYLEGSLTI